MDADISGLMGRHIKKHKDLSQTDILNAALHQFFTAGDKKQRKYLKKYMARMYDEDHLNMIGKNGDLADED
jgi:hypothetical protein